ncbi:sugar phosphate isomerase/epimerase family protein [Haloarchaeobius sp. TZWSO28]|uniref:sugar phosphate isomerase/epimerase family protein n=1 Tax=Haloarchaeobius sp. TZWSO28 TaxID=3446119 RepID=UPI003EB8216F
MRLGLCTISNVNLPVERVLDVAAHAGFDGVEIWGKDHVGDGSPAACEAIRGTAEDLGLDIGVYGSYLTVGTDEFASAYEHELAVADQLGADLLRVWPGKREYGCHHPHEFEAAVADLRTITERANDRGLAVTIEKHAGRLSNTADGALALVDAVDHPACGLNWQPLFELEEQALHSEIEVLAPHTNNVHLQAPAERGGDERAPLSDAYFDVGTVVERFEAAGFDGYFEVEFVAQSHDYETAVRRDYEYLRSVLGSAGD